MSGRKLIGTTVVRNPETQGVVTLRPGMKVPDWAEDQVGDHLFKSKAQSDAAVEPQQSTPPAPAPAQQQDGQPPRAGRGSSLEAWAEYAAKVPIAVPEGATRDEIIALVDAQQS